MALKEIFQKVKPLRIEEIRRITEDYCELVFFRSELEAFTRILEEYLGPAFKPAGDETTDEMVALTEDYGEIVDHQTLFVRDVNGSKMIAMLWPWRDETRITLIMGYIGG